MNPAKVYCKLLFVLIIQLIAACQNRLFCETKTHYCINTQNGLSDNQVLQMLQLQDGRMVICTKETINIYDGQHFSYIDRKTAGHIPLRNYNGHTHLYIDKQQRLWIKGYRKLYCIDLQRMSGYPSPETLFHRNVDDFYIDGNLDIWIVDGNHIAKTSENHEFIIPVDAGSVQDIDVHHDTLYAFTSTGKVMAYHPRQQLPIYQAAAYGKDEALQFANTSLIVKGTEAIIYQVRMGAKQSVLLAFDIHARTWRRIMQSPYPMHTLIVTAANTAYVTEPDGYRVIDLASGEQTVLKKLRLPDGSMLGTGINTVCQDREGGIWLGTYDTGILYSSPLSGLFDTRPIDIQASPVLTEIFLHSERMQVGQTYGKLKMEVAPPYVKHLTLAHDQNSIAFKFSTMNYARPRSTCYRYRFSGERSGWHIVSADSVGRYVDDQGTLYLPFIGLSPGKYCLEVMSSTNPQKWNEEQIYTLLFEIEAPWWATPASFAVYALLAAILMWGGVFLYTRNVRIRMIRKNKEEILLLRIKNLMEQVNNYQSSCNITLTETPAEETEKEMTPQEIAFMNRATDLVIQNLSNQEYTVEQLSRDLCMERTGLYKKLTALLDKSPVTFIRSIRLNRAAEMICRQEKSITEIAEETGFCSTSYFSKCFQKEFGCKPSEYLQKHSS